MPGQWLDGVPSPPDNLNWRKVGFKNLDVFQRSDEFMERNLEGAPESVKGRWWLLSNISVQKCTDSLIIGLLC